MPKETGPVGHLGVPANGSAPMPGSSSGNVKLEGMTNGVEHMRNTIMATRIGNSLAQNSNMESLKSQAGYRKV